MAEIQEMVEFLGWSDFCTQWFISWMEDENFESFY